VDPNGDVRRDYRFYRVVTRAGTTATGRLLNHDTWTVQLMDTNNRLLSFEKATLREHGVVQGSPMPAYGQKLTAEQLDQLVEYLSGLRGSN
jgi:hypothetical protein